MMVLASYKRLIHDGNESKNGYLTVRLNNTWSKNQLIWLTIDWSKPTNDWWQTLRESFSQYHHGQTDQSCSTDQTYYIIDRQTLLTLLWRWLPNVHQQRSFQNYSHPDDHTIRTSDTPGMQTIYYVTRISLMWMKMNFKGRTHFHVSGFPLWLVLVQRQKGTRAWPILGATILTSNWDLIEGGGGGGKSAWRRVSIPPPIDFWPNYPESR